jgi:hypothetical protein
MPVDIHPEIGIIYAHVPAQAFDWMNRQGRYVLAENRVRYVVRSASKGTKS